MFTYILIIIILKIDGLSYSSNLRMLSQVKVSPRVQYLVQYLRYLKEGAIYRGRNMTSSFIFPT